MKHIIFTIFIVGALLSPVTATAQGTFNSINVNNGGNSNNDIGATLKTIGPAAITCLLTSEKGQSILNNLGSKITTLTQNTVVGKFLSFFKAASGGGSATPVEDKLARERLAALNRKEQCWDQIAKGVANKAMVTMTNKTVGWVNTGFDGNPLYIRNIDSYLKSVRDQQIKKFLPETATNDPIFGNALRSIIQKQVTGRSDGLLNKAKTTPEAIAYQNFTKDFTQGGWSALLNTSNNPLSSLFRETNKLSSIISTQTNNTQQELLRNNGFLDIKTCVETDKTDSTKCIRYSTVTPGSVIAGQLGTTLGSPTRQLELVDEINEVINAFFGKLVDGLFMKNSGLYGLGSVGGSFGGTGLGSNIILDGDGNQILSKNVLGQIQPQSGVSDVDVSRPQTLRRLIRIQKDFLNYNNDITIAARNIIPELGYLDYCMPGPNPGAISGAGQSMASLIDHLAFDIETRFDVGITPFPRTDPVTDTEVAPSTKGGPFEPFLDVRNVTFFGKTPQPYPAIILFNFNPNQKGQVSALQNWFSSGYSLLRQELSTTYNEQSIANAFANTGGDSTINKGQAVTAYRMTENLIPYAREVAQLESDNVDNQSSIAANLIELEGIHAEAIQIVKVAKARYIAQRAAAGNPVDMTCINNAYVIDETPITATEDLKESTAINPKIKALEEANTYFKNTL